MDASVSDINAGSRKKFKKSAKQEKFENNKYSDNNPKLRGFNRPCNHNSKALKCNTITLEEVKRRRDFFYKTSNKIEQDRKLSHMMAVCEPSRSRSRANTPPGKGKKKMISVSYLFRNATGGYTPVCQKFILETLGIKKDRLISVAKTIHAGEIPKEKRGGDRKSKKSEPTKNKIKEFIGRFKESESHYGKKKTKRIYLSGDLSIKKMHTLYNESVTQQYQASHSMFRRVFLKDFNIGFKSPAFDICPTCFNLKHSIQQTNDKRKKSTLMAQHRLHKLRAKAFYKLAQKQEPAIHTACFDLQQVHPLPKIPIGEAFYKRQIDYYSFCCVGMDSKQPIFFTWTEDQAGRGAVEVGSALLTYLRSLNFNDNNINTVRLFCDGCGAQNKNCHIVHILAYWLLRESPKYITNVELIFPVRGHSYLPADRAFSRVQKKLKKENFINTAEQYNEIYKKVGVVRQLGDDWQLYNVKDLLNVYKKVKGMQNQKSIFLKKMEKNKKKQHTAIYFSAQQFYLFKNENKKYTPLVKNGKKENLFKLKRLQLKCKINPSKLKDVRELLEKQYNRQEGNITIKWQDLPELEYYKKILEEDTGVNDDEDEEEEEEVSDDEEGCNCLEEDCGIHL